MEIPQMAPDSPAPKKIKIEVFVSPELLSKAKSIAQRQGKPIAEFHRNCWEAGLVGEVGKDTAFLVNAKVERRLGLAPVADDPLEAVDTDDEED